MRISDWSSDVCSSDLAGHTCAWHAPAVHRRATGGTTCTESGCCASCSPVRWHPLPRAWSIHRLQDSPSKIPATYRWMRTRRGGRWSTTSIAGGRRTTAGGVANPRCRSNPSPVAASERTADGKRSARHMVVVFAEPGKLLRLAGGLGPLQGMGLHGVMEWRLAPIEGGTRVTLFYRAGGYTPDDLSKFAPVVDRVQTLQLGGFADHLGAAPATPGGEG